MKSVGFAALLVCAASQAYALSCVQPDIERSFNRWVDSEDTYYIGVGSLRALEPLPEVKAGPGFERTGPPLSASFQFSGHLLGPDQQYPFDMPITVTVSCVASWCGGFPEDGRSGLMALQGVGVMNLTLAMHACPGSIFPVEVEAQVTSCLQSGRCPER